MPRNLTAEQQRWVKRVRELAEAGKVTGPMVRDWLTQIQAGREPVWRVEEPLPDAPEQIRQSLQDHLRGVIAAAEAELKQLGCYPAAWQQFTAHLTDTMPRFGFGGWAERLLGRMSPRDGRGVIPTRELRAFTEIEKQAKHCDRCRALRRPKGRRQA